MCPVAVRSRVPISLSVQLTNYLQVPPHSEEATQAMRARQELQSHLGVHSTALLCTHVGVFGLEHLRLTRGPPKPRNGGRPPLKVEKRVLDEVGRLYTQLLVGAYGWVEGAFLGFVGCLWVMSCGDTGFACEVVHVPRNAAASSKKRPTVPVPHRHPPAPLLRPRRRRVPLQLSVFMGGAVARCCFLAESEDRQKRGKCKRNGVVSAREPAMGTQGCM
jgi:hypothetical protein